MKKVIKKVLTGLVVGCIILLGTSSNINSYTYNSYLDSIDINNNIVYNRILAFLINKNVSNPYYKAYILSSAKRPFTITAIGYLESKGTFEHIRGRDGEVSAFQILNPPADFNKFSLNQSMQWAEAMLEDGIVQHKSYYKGIRQYNGGVTNPQTRIYANRILQIIKEIG